MGLHSLRPKSEIPHTNDTEAMRLAEGEEGSHPVHHCNASRIDTSTTTRTTYRFRAAATCARVSIRSLLLEGR